MGKPTKKLRAIDLYSGVGGWSLGLRLAGIEVVASYELWGTANETNFKNNHHQAQTVDIRRLSLDELPKRIDIVVGSPPCTQFSFSNRGGTGDIADGLRDIVKFLTIVDFLKPKAWAMENVPRAAKIINDELKPGGRLRRFKHLNIATHVVNMEDFGIPQRRKRCIAGSFDFELLRSFSSQLVKTTLGEIVSALNADPVIDPMYRIEIGKRDLRDHVIEDYLNLEEVRINKSNKTIHPVYNKMPFPDPLNRSVRTITATCTRVSRESIVIRDSRKRATFRRLTIRERATLQGFPVTFQFYGASHAQKLRMVGNAIPPAFSFYIAQAFKGVQPHKLPSIANTAKKMLTAVTPATDVQPDRAGANYPENRRFRFAIPSLRLKSGVRFELVNIFHRGSVGWRVNFYFGTSKSIHDLILDRAMYRRLLSGLPEFQCKRIVSALSGLSEFIGDADIAHMQRLWSHRGLGRTRPFMLLDKIDEVGAMVVRILMDHKTVSRSLVLKAVGFCYPGESEGVAGLNKLDRNAPLILAGLLVGCITNIELTKKEGFALSSVRRA